MAAVAVACLSAIFAVTLAHTFAFIDGVLSPDRRKGVVASTARFIRSRAGSRGGARSAGESSVQQQQPSQHTKTPSPGSSKFRSLHWKLLAGHVTAMTGQVAALLKFALPVSQSSCALTHAVMAAFILLFDACVVTFLLAKVDVTNGQRTRRCWENVITWLSRAYAWIYLPCSAVYVALSYKGGDNAEGTVCVRFAGGEDHDAERLSGVLGYATNNASLIVQFFLLLLLFVKPLLVRQDDTQSGGVLYKRVVVRNLVCTGAICASYLVASAIVVVAIFNESDVNDKATALSAVVLMLNMLVVLGLIEISLPLGFTSAWKSVAVNCRTTHQRKEETEEDEVMSHSGTDSRAYSSGTIV